MSTTTLKLQNIVFPVDDTFSDKPELAFRANGALYDQQTNALTIPAHASADFATYLNSCSQRKWYRYTCTNRLVLKLDVQGAFTLTVAGYSIAEPHFNEEALCENGAAYSRLLRTTFEATERRIVEVEIPRTEDTVVGFKIETNDEATLFGGSWNAVVPTGGIRDVDLAILMTTFKKEEFVTRNMNLLKRDILNTDEPMADRFSMIVADNGSTLDVKELECPGISIFPNPNTGGAGGFARGMIEAIHRDNPPTHVLVMDDDVMILPESIMRTYNLLSIMRPEYQHHFISGAMLHLEYKDVQHEDIGCVNPRGWFGGVKPDLKLSETAQMVLNEEDWDLPSDVYGAWWYCCMPIEVIRDDNLPYPVFVRGDDAEFGLRNKASFITMNGLFVWHQGFGTKSNAAVDYYLNHRNAMAIQAASGVAPSAHMVRHSFEVALLEILHYNYASCDIVIDSIEDFLAGPQVFIDSQGPELLAREGAKAEKLYPLSDFDNLTFNRDFSYFEKVDFSKVDHGLKIKPLYWSTVNGHFGPERLIKDKIAVLSQNARFNTDDYQLNRGILFVNVNDMTAAYRPLDRAAGRERINKLKALWKTYQKDKAQIEAAYRDRFAYMTSLAFWTEHLGL